MTSQAPDPTMDDDAAVSASTVRTRADWRLKCATFDAPSGELPANPKEECTRAILANPEDGLLWVQRSSLHLLQGRPANAAADALRAVELLPKEPRAHMAAARAYWDLTDYQTAVQYLKKAKPKEDEEVAAFLDECMNKAKEGLTPTQKMFKGKAMAWYTPSFTDRYDTPLCTVDELNSLISSAASTCRATVREADSHGGFGLFATESVKMDGSLLVEPALFTVSVDTDLCLVCAKKMKSTHACLYCGVEVYCSKECRKAAWGDYHRSQCGEVAKATHRLRDAFKNYVNDKKTTLLASYLPLAVSRIAGMILAYQKELHGDGEPPPFAAWDRKTWPPLLRQLSRLTDSSAAEEIRSQVSHPFDVWYTYHYHAGVINGSMPLDAVGKATFDFQFYEEVAHLCMANMIGTPSGNALVMMRGACYANHSCLPNCVIDMDVEGLIVLRAKRAIAVGEELTISYIDSKLPKDQRLEALRQKYWFDCKCKACTNEDLRVGSA